MTTEGAPCPEAELTPREELSSIVAALRAHLEWQIESGAAGVPRDFLFKPQTLELRGDGLDPSLRPVERQASSQPHREPLRAPPAMVPQGSPLTSAPREHPAAAPTSTQSPRSKSAATAKAPGPPPASSLVQLGKTLDELRVRVAECELCALHLTRSKTVFSRGTGANGLLFVGDAPEHEDEALGGPFSGEAGDLLDKMIVAMGLSPAEVYVCATVKCRPPDDRHPTSAETKACSDYLRRQIELTSPQVIVAMGGAAVSGLLGISEGITRVRGKFRLYQGRIAVMPTFHPAYLLKNPSAKREVWADLRQVLQHMGRELPPRNEPGLNQA